MKRLKGFKNRTLSSFTVGMNQRPIVMTILMLLGINFAFLLVAAIAAMFVSQDGYATFFHAFADVFSFLVIPASVAGIEDTGMLVLGTIVVVVGMLLFTGIIIALVTTTLRDYLTSKGGAKGKLNISGHIVILRYNNEVPAILTDLMNSCEKPTVLILSDRPREEVRADLMARISSMEKPPKGRIKLLVRQGDPASINELEEIGIEYAKGLLVMNDRRSGSEDISSADFNGVLKIVLKMAHFNFEQGFPIGVETSTQDAADIMRGLKQNIEGLADKDIQFFSHNKKLGQSLAFAVICPDLFSVVRDVLSAKGCTFYSVPVETRENVLSNFASALPTICFEDRMFVLADGVESATRQRGKPFVTDRVLKPIVGKPYMPKKLFVIGENKKLRYMLEALEIDGKDIEIKKYPMDDVEKFVTDLKKHGDESTVAVVLSDESVDEDNYDGNVFQTLIEISHEIGIKDRKFRIVAEILDPENQKSLEKFNVQSIVVCTEIVSHFASKLLKDSRAERFYEEIFSYCSKYINMRVRDAGALFGITQAEKFSGRAEFVHAVYNGSGKKIMPIGMMCGDKRVFFCCDLSDENEFVIKPECKIIFAELLV